MDRRKSSLYLLSLLGLVVDAALSSIDLFVSPSGSDANDGTLAKPFRTLARVQSEVRTRKSSMPPLLPINVFLRRGRYELLQTLEFTPEDTGGSPQSIVTYQAYCDAAVESSLKSVEPFPYKTHLATPPRLLWNGNGDTAAWLGPMDPFLEMAVNRATNSVVTSPLPLPAPIPVMDIGDVCVDKAVTGGASGSSAGGHTCYAGAIATCVQGCQSACTLHLERKTYSAEFYREFSHLFGKKLVREDDCVERCALACRGCESVTLSGAKRILPGEISSWSLYKTATISGGVVASIFRADLTPFLPATPIAADTPTIFSRLFVNDIQLPRAGYPNCKVVPDVGSSLTEFDCTYATPRVTSKARTVAFTTATFSSRVAQWTKPSLAEIEVLPNNPTPSLANLRYTIAALDAADGEIALGAGGAQLTVDDFKRGGVDLSTAASAARARFRVENVLEELDAPGEWFFDPSTKLLYIMPLDAAATLVTMATLTLEIPLLRQLVRVSGSRENVYTAPAHASSSLVETDSTAPATNLAFRQLTFSGTQLLTGDVYEQIPGSSSPPWPMARIGAVYMETVANVTIEYSTFEKIGGNAIVVSGESDTVSLHHNNISYVGSSGIALLARTAALQRNSLGQVVLAHQLFSRLPNVSHNQIHHFGRCVAHSSAVMVVGATQTSVQENLIFAFPPVTGRNYWIANADGSGRGTRDSSTTGLVRGLETVITIPQTLATSLSTAYMTTVTVASPGFDIPVVAKLIGAPPCASGSGRIGSLYGEPLPFTYTQCSGCCSVHANGAKLRVAGSGIAWADATSREVVLRPGESLELQAKSSPLFNSITDVYMGFHIVTANQILELPSVRAKWTILTRKCQHAERTYQVQCSGPCASSASSLSTATGCGNSNIALQTSRTGALKCAADSEPDVNSLVCTGPFEASADCDGSGVKKSHVYFNCVMKCFSTTCT